MELPLIDKSRHNNRVVIERALNDELNHLAHIELYDHSPGKIQRIQEVQEKIDHLRSML